MTCEYPEGAVNEDGADEAYCESHRRIGSEHIAHEMSNGLTRVHHEDRGYVDSVDDLAAARELIKELAHA